MRYKVRAHIMWNCRVSSSNANNNYGAYTAVFNNILGFIINDERSAHTYIDLINENREIFLEASEKSFNEIVEPRELLFLINHIDTATRLYWSPRPYRRSGFIEKEFLFLCPENNSLVCLFCGFKSMMETGTHITCELRNNNNNTSSNREQQDQVDSLFRRAIESRSQQQQRREEDESDESDFIPQVDINRDIISEVIVLAHEVFQNQSAQIQQGTLQETFGGLNERNYIPSSGNTVNQTTLREEDLTIGAMETVNTLSGTTSRTQHHCHFRKCPLVWLDKNCTWQTKYSRKVIHEPSKFGFVLGLLENRDKTNFMATEMEWREFAQLTSRTPIMGSCEHTLSRCYRMLVEMKLDKVDRYHGDSHEFRRLPLFPVFYDTAIEKAKELKRPSITRPLACVLEHSPLYGSCYRQDRRCSTMVGIYDQGQSILDLFKERELSDRIRRDRTEELVSETRESKNFLSHILSIEKESSTPQTPSSSSTSHPPTLCNKRVTYAVDMEIAWRAFVMHGFCVQYRQSQVTEDVYEVHMSGEYSNGQHGGYSIRHRLGIPTTSMMCIYCGYIFDSKLCRPEVVDFLYDQFEKDSIVEYLISRSPRNFFVNNGKIPVWWDRKPGPNSHLAVSPGEVLWQEKTLDTNNNRKRKRQDDCNNNKIALWLSASLDCSHSLKCIFRIKNRVWPVDNCPVCLVTETSAQISPFTCGHTICNTCTNNVSITKCPLCKEGTRKHHITVDTAHTE